MSTPPPHPTAPPHCPASLHLETCPGVTGSDLEVLKISLIAAVWQQSAPMAGNFTCNRRVVARALYRQLALPIPSSLTLDPIPLSQYPCTANSTAERFSPPLLSLPILFSPIFFFSFFLSSISLVLRLVFPCFCVRTRTVLDMVNHLQLTSPLQTLNGSDVRKGWLSGVYNWHDSFSWVSSLWCSRSCCRGVKHNRPCCGCSWFLPSCQWVQLYISFFSLSMKCSQCCIYFMKVVNFAVNIENYYSAWLIFNSVVHI